MQEKLLKEKCLLTSYFQFAILVIKSIALLGGT